MIPHTPIKTPVIVAGWAGYIVWASFGMVMIPIVRLTMLYGHMKEFSASRCSMLRCACGSARSGD